MTPEELLLPRYKVIADYIHSPYTIGMLVENTFSEIMRHRENVSWLLTQTSCYDGFTGDEKVDNYFPEQRLIELPHIFKKLEWWEERDEKDMPEYVRVTGRDNVYKVNQYLNFNMAEIVYLGKKTRNIHLKNLLPATEEEYINQNK